MTTSTMHRIVAIGGAILLALALSAAFALAQTSGAPTSAASYVPPTDSVSGQSMLELLMRASRDEIRQSRTVAGATRNGDVRRFAQTLVDEHSAALSNANALWDRLSYTRADTVSTIPAVGPTADSGLGGGLSALADADADRSYLSNQVATLQSLLTQLRQRNGMVADPAVRTFATEMQATLERQLAEATRLQGPRPAAP